jgi:ABC-type antimicrobial peptide transport system permease subunit
VAEDLRRSVAAIDPELPLYGVRTMTTILSDSMGQPRFRAFLIAVFAGISLLLAAIGIYGVISYWVTQRRREIGIRVALGAERVDVLRLILGQGMRAAAIGVGIGLAGGELGARIIENFLFDVPASDPATFAAAAIVLLAVALCACLVPARRAAGMNSIAALREE